MYQACDLLVEVHHIASDLIILLSVHPTWGEDEVELPYEYDGDARRKIRIKPLRETSVGVALAQPSLLYKFSPCTEYVA